MDIATIIGIVLGIGLIIGSILLGGSLMAFVNAPGLLVVMGGTLAATLINQKLGNVIGAFSIAMNAFFDRVTPTPLLLETIEELTQKARKDGVLGLEEVEVSDPFLARGVVMAIDGMDRDFVLSTMRQEMYAIQSRHQRGQAIFKFMESTAPAMGMIGTLIGLVNMLQTLDDPSAIGPAMAVALLTTFYGAVIAFLFCGPIAAKLDGRTKAEVDRCMIAIAGIDAVLSGDNKNVTKTKIEALLPPKERSSSEEEG